MKVQFRSHFKYLLLFMCVTQACELLLVSGIKHELHSSKNNSVQILHFPKHFFWDDPLDFLV